MVYFDDTHFAMKNKKRTVLILLSAGVVGLLVWALLPGPVPVSAVVVERAAFTDYVEEEGRTALRDPHTFTAPVGGHLRRVTWEVGDTIEAGEVLFSIEPGPAPTLDARSLEQARSAVGAAEARLAAVEAEREARALEARFLEKEWERTENLHASGAVSTAQLDAMRDRRDRSRSALRAAGNTVASARYELRNARALLDVADGERAGNGVLVVRAPFSGSVLARHRWDEGALQPGEAILGVGDLAAVEARIDVLSMDAVRIREGMKAMLTRWGGDDDLPGRVRRVEPAGFMRISALGVEEQRVPVWVTLEAPREDWAMLGTGYRVEARFILWEGDDVVQVPTSALFREEDAWAVFAVREGCARRTVIEPGRRSGLWTQVLSGVEGGETVITHPGDRITDGSRVSPELRPYR